MYLVGYSLDNLSLMALTISVGFVVDDAIVMLENIVRHVEDGMKPYEAALKGSGEIAFTILSISISLVAVFIPLLLMGGIIGRLFREFAVTVTMCIARVGVRRPDADADDGLALPAAARRRAKHGRFYQITERGFDTHAARLRARPRCRPAPPVRHAVRVPGDAGADRLSVHHHPQGLLPAAGHRPHHRHIGGRARTSRSPR